MFNLIQRFFLPIEPLDAHDIESITNQIGFDRHVEWGVASHRGTQIDFEEPRLEIGIDQDIEAENLKAVGPMSLILLHGILDLVLATENCLDYDVVGSGPEQVHVDSDLFQVLAEGTQGPLVAEVVLLAVLVLDEFLVLFVD